MILASVQTSADTTPFAGYAEGVGLFLAISAAFIGACWLVDRYVITRYLRPTAQVRQSAAQLDAWDAYQTALARRVR